jgi:hypothetical protein
MCNILLFGLLFGLSAGFMAAVDVFFFGAALVKLPVLQCHPFQASGMLEYRGK